ncbi:MAG TPA: copper chaperone [Flavobacteriaceae bacterium]|jgi:copper chaperone CopZ|nr:copper chaperone [Flavobacteriaceae bacterium]|tara:strand:- start:712 stop:1122 length:411 start_codon:yes stop_codon:yes gene_type:complete
MKKNSKIIIAIIIFSPFVWVFWPSNSTEQISKPNPEEIVELMGTETSFGVKGNCKMCKSTIETAALSLDGVLKADWDVKTKQVSLVYDTQMVDLTSIHQAISNSGYGTDLNELNKEAYDNLPLCCQYDPEMEIKLN